MSQEFCPLKALRSGDLGINAYIVGATPLLRTKFRLNCSHCETGYVDFVGTEIQPIGDDPSRFQIKIDRVLAVHDCGKE